MTATPNLGLTYVEIGQKDKSTTLNTNMSLIDNLPAYLGELSSDPVTTGTAPGSTYYNTTGSNLKVLKSDLTWTNT